MDWVGAKPILHLYCRPVDGAKALEKPLAYLIMANMWKINCK